MSHGLDSLQYFSREISLRGHTRNKNQRKEQCPPTLNLHKSKPFRPTNILNIQSNLKPVCQCQKKGIKTECLLNHHNNQHHCYSNPRWPDLGALLVVVACVAEHQPHVLHQGVLAGVLVVADVVLHRTQVHGLQDHLGVGVEGGEGVEEAVLEYPDPLTLYTCVCWQVDSKMLFDFFL